MSDRRVVITGMGAITPLGCTTDEFWDGLVCGRSGVKTITRCNLENSPVRFGGECTDFDPSRYLDPKEAKRLDRFSQLAVGAAQEAVAQSGIESGKIDPLRFGVILGVGMGGLQELETQHLRMLNKGPERVSAFTIPRLMPNAASGHLSIMFNARATAITVATACASGTNAIGQAFWTIRDGQADVIMTGGAEAALTPLGIAAFAAMKALSTRNDAPEEASRPFDRDRDGFVLGEGAGILILEELEHAKRRGVPILAEVLGYGTSADAHHIAQPDENGIGGIEATKRALADGRLSPDDVQYVNAHGTGTYLGDIVETKAIREVFGPAANSLMVSSTKSSIGHLLGASGAVELVATVNTIRKGIVPPTINLDCPDEQCDLDYVPKKAREVPVDRAMNNSFGFGGHNGCVVIGRFD